MSRIYSSSLSSRTALLRCNSFRSRDRNFGGVARVAFRGQLEKIPRELVALSLFLGKFLRCRATDHRRFSSDGGGCLGLVLSIGQRAARHCRPVCLRGDDALSRLHDRRTDAEMH